MRDPFDTDTDSDLPPWAGPSVYPARPARTSRRRPDPLAGSPDPQNGQDGGLPDDDAREDRAGYRQARPRRGRAAAARLRKSRRRVYTWCGLAIAAAVVVAGSLWLTSQGKPAAHPGYVTTLQPGEFRAVPDACNAASSSLLGQYLPGPGRRTTQSVASRTESQCTFTVDSKPVFRVLEITGQAFQPSLLAGGNGSATENAMASFAASRQSLSRPAKKSVQPPAVISRLSGLGQQALSALQIFRSGGTTTDVVTVLARERNALITVSLQGQASGGGFGPVSVSVLRAGAIATAREVLAKLAAEPTVTG